MFAHNFCFSFSFRSFGNVEDGKDKNESNKSTSSSITHQTSSYYLPLRYQEFHHRYHKWLYEFHIIMLTYYVNQRERCGALLSEVWNVVGNWACSSRVNQQRVVVVK